MSKHKGRPTGSPNVTTTQIVDLPRCPRCRKTDRERYRFVSCVDHGGVTADGREYTHVVRRRTRCTACGQVRTDAFFENRAPEKNPFDEDEPQ